MCFGFGSFIFRVFSREKSPEYDFLVNHPLHNLYVSVMAVAQPIISAFHVSSLTLK